ncbi:MAG: helix-turn-helix domain-containing protein [Oscillospiraceae bacterium]|nr:helix-turn-helix domain-containing protein [Oscillospiraceae bacterium]
MVYKKLRELRLSKDLKQEDMAKLLNITRSAYSAYEIGKRQMNHESIVNLADFFGVTTDYILGRSEQPPFLFTESEKELLIKYRSLSKDKRQTISALIDVETTRLPPQKASEGRAI